MADNLGNESNYSASNIQVLEGLEAVRKRPAMYIGDISEKGLHHLINETVDNSIDEAMAGYCSHIEVTINEDNSVTVEDDGRGIPVDEHEKLHKSALEVVMTVLHAGGKFDKGSYKVSGGLHGVGVSCVNALSSHMKSQVFRNGKIYQQEYEQGKPLYPVKVVGETDKTGTRQQFWPDGSIFTTTVFQWEIVARRMRELAFLNAGIKITLTDLRPNSEGKTRQEVFHAKEGLKEFVRYVDRHRTHLFDDVIYLKTEKQGIPIEVAIMYNTDYNENIHSYVNNINTIEGGTHLTGFRTALTRTLKAYADNDPQIAKQIEKAKIEIDENTSFASSLRTVLRQDPDIILVGEIRDLETAEIAMQSGQTGHYVLSTIHTIDAIEVVTRLRKMGISNYDIASTLATSVSQRLVRRICPYCSKERDYTEEEKKIITEIGEKNNTKFDLTKKKTFDTCGCEKCNYTGFLGRIAAFEVLNLDDEIKQAIMEEKSTIEIRKIAMKKNYRPLVIDAMKKVLDGFTTLRRS